MKKMTSIALLFAGCALGALAQQAVPTTFPQEAASLGADELKQRLADKVFDVKLADGGTWRLQYKSNGYFFVNTGSGFNGSGSWRTEDGKLCTVLRNISSSCNEMRRSGEVLYLKRDSGEVVTFNAH